MPDAPVTDELLEALPKTDLHCHLDGSLRLNTILELAEEQKVKLPDETPEGLARAMHQGQVCADLEDYLTAFALRLAELAVAFKNRGVVGYDLAGAEEGYPSKDHQAAFQLILDNNVNVTIHAGEAYGPESIAQAVHYCGAHRIGHGVRLRENGDLLNYVNDHRIPLEMCPSSNVQTRSVAGFDSHPLKFYFDFGLRVTVNTDNRLITSTTATDELWICHERMGFTLEDLVEVIVQGFKSAFLPFREKRDLLERVNRDIAETLTRFAAGPRAVEGAAAAKA